MTKKVFFNLLLGMLLTIHSLPIFAQSAPNWYDNDMRRSFYPESQYFIGYAEGQRMGMVRQFLR